MTKTVFVYFRVVLLDVYNNGGTATFTLILRPWKAGINARSTDIRMSSLVHESGKHNAHNRFSGTTDDDFP